MRRQKNILLSIAFALSFVVMFTSQTQAAVGDCLSWLWGGNNESTTYSPPYPANYSPTAQEEKRPPTAESGNPYVLGQSAGSAPTVYVSPPPSYTVVGPNPCYDVNTVNTYARKPESSNSDALVQSNQNTTMQPTITKEWSYSRVESVKYKPVEIVDPSTGATSTAYREEKSKTLLPWLHQKEKIEYKPVLTHKPRYEPMSGSSATPVPLYTPLYAPPLTTSSPPQVVQTNYAAPIPAPCSSGGVVVSGSQAIPYTPVEGSVFQRNPDASTRSSTYFSQGGSSRYSHISNFGIPPVREGYERDRSSSFVSDPEALTNVPASAADTVPVLEPGTQRLQKPAQNSDTVSISAADIRPVHPYSETLKERAGEEEKANTDVSVDNVSKKPEVPKVIQVSNLIRTPAPDLPIVNKPEIEQQEEQPIVEVKKPKKKTAPTQMFKF